MMFKLIEAKEKTLKLVQNRLDSGRYSSEELKGLLFTQKSLEDGILVAKNLIKSEKLK